MFKQCRKNCRHGDEFAYRWRACRIMFVDLICEMKLQLPWSVLFEEIWKSEKASLTGHFCGVCQSWCEWKKKFPGPSTSTYDAMCINEASMRWGVIFNIFLMDIFVACDELRAEKLLMRFCDRIEVIFPGRLRDEENKCVWPVDSRWWWRLVSVRESTVWVFPRLRYWNKLIVVWHVCVKLSFVMRFFESFV